MALKPNERSTATPSQAEFFTPEDSPPDFPANLMSERSPLVRLQRTETFLRQQTLDRLTPVLPLKTAHKLHQWSHLADQSLQELSQIDLAQITDQDLKSARVLVGLTLAGFGSLFLVWLLLYLYVLHPELNPAQQIHTYWYLYIGFVSLGVTGLILLGREAMRRR